MAPYKPLFAPTPRRPYKSGLGGMAILRDQFPTSTLLLLGAALLGTISLVIRSHWVVLPVYGLLMAKSVDTYLQAKGWKKNAQMEGVIRNKFTAQLPPVQGEEDTPGAQGVVVFILGARINHPLGFMAPGVKELGEWAQKCYKELEDKYDEYGMLGMSTYLGTSRASGNEILTLMYFRNTYGLHTFALSETHRATWNWWLAVQKKYQHMGIMHETYDVPPRHWESVYVRMHRMGLAGASVRLTQEEREMLVPQQAEGGEMWWSTPVDATRGKMRSSKGRMDRSDGGENEKAGYGEMY